MNNTFLNWIKLNYFVGDFYVVTCHEVDLSWEIVTSRFQAKMKMMNEKRSDVLVGIGENSITVNNQNFTGLKYPNQFVFTSSEITLNGRNLTIATNVWLSDFNSVFFPVWKVIVFGITVVVLSIFLFHLKDVSPDPSNILGVFVLLVFNSVCWLSTLFLKTEARSMENRILKIVNGIGLT